MVISSLGKRVPVFGTEAINGGQWIEEVLREYNPLLGKTACFARTERTHELLQAPGSCISVSG